VDAAVRGQWAELWALPGYRRVMWSRIISNLGNGITPIALAFGVLDIEGSNGKSLSLVTGAHSVAVILFMIVGGVVADRFGRLRAVGLSDIVGSLVAGASAVLLITGRATVPLLAVNGFVMGFLNAVWLPAYRGIIPQLVPAHLLRSANALNGVFANVFMVMGSASAGVIVSLVGAGWGVLLDAATFLVAGILVFSLRRFDTAGAEPADRESPFAQIRAGWREFSSRGWLVGGAIGSALYHFAFEGFIAVAGPVQAKRHLGGASAWGLTMAGWGIGGLIGVLATARLHPRRPLRAGWSFAHPLTAPRPSSSTTTCARSSTTISSRPSRPANARRARRHRPVSACRWARTRSGRCASRYPRAQPPTTCLASCWASSASRRPARHSRAWAPMCCCSTSPAAA